MSGPVAGELQRGDSPGGDGDGLRNSIAEIESRALVGACLVSVSRCRGCRDGTRDTPASAGQLVRRRCLADAAGRGERREDRLTRYPDVHDGAERLAMVYEARGDRKQTAEYYRRALALMRENADSYDPEAIDGMRRKAESMEQNP